MARTGTGVLGLEFDGRRGWPVSQVILLTVLLLGNWVRVSNGCRTQYGVLRQWAAHGPRPQFLGRHQRATSPSFLLSGLAPNWYVLLCM